MIYDFYPNICNSLNNNHIYHFDSFGRFKHTPTSRPWKIFPIWVWLWPSKYFPETSVTSIFSISSIISCLRHRNRIHSTYTCHSPISLINRVFYASYPYSFDLTFRSFPWVEWRLSPMITLILILVVFINNN